jgi:hypothetical protein
LWRFYVYNHETQIIDWRNRILQIDLAILCCIVDLSMGGPRLRAALAAGLFSSIASAAGSTSYWLAQTLKTQSRSGEEGVILLLVRALGPVWAATLSVGEAVLPTRAAEGGDGPDGAQFCRLDSLSCVYEPDVPAEEWFNVLCSLLLPTAIADVARAAVWGAGSPNPSPCDLTCLEYSPSVLLAAASVAHLALSLFWALVLCWVHDSSPWRGPVLFGALGALIHVIDLGVAVPLLIPPDRAVHQLAPFPQLLDHVAFSLMVWAYLRLRR